MPAGDLSGQDSSGRDSDVSSPEHTLLPSQDQTTRPSAAGTATSNTNGPARIEGTSSRAVPGLAKKYIGGSFWSTLTEEVNALARVLGKDDLLNDGNQADGTPTDLVSSSSSGVTQEHRSSPPSYELLSSTSGPFHIRPSSLRHITSWDVPRLLNTYLKRLEPLHKVFHVPSITALTGFGRPYLQQPADTPSNQFLKASICFAGISALSDSECWTSYRMSKVHAVQEFKRTIVERSLQEADPLVSPDLATLQAFVLYAMSMRITDSSRRSWCLIGLAAQIARSTYLYQPTTEDSPYINQLRLRLWHCISFAYHYASRDRGTESILSGFPQVPMPMNCNDEDFGPDSTFIRSRVNEITAMTVPLIALHGVSVSNEMEEPGRTWEQRLALAERYRADMQIHIISASGDPRQRQIEQGVTIVYNGLVLRAVRPLHVAAGEATPSVSQPWILRVAVEQLQSALQIVPDAGWTRMPWIPWHAIAVVLAGLCTIKSSDPADAALLDQAWQMVEKSIAVYEPDVADGKDGMLWRPILKVYAKALAYRDVSRTQAAGSGSFGLQAVEPAAKHVAVGQAAEHAAGRPVEKAPAASMNSLLSAHSEQSVETQRAAFIAALSAAPVREPEHNILPADDSWLNWETIMADLGSSCEYYYSDNIY